MLNRTKYNSALLLSLVSAMGTTQALAGPDWLETTDAGSTISTAQVPTRPDGVLALTSIAGSLSEGFTQPDYEDLYYIRVLQPTLFSVRPAFADFNAIMYIFNITLNGEGYGLLANDDESSTSNLPKLRSQSDDGTQVILAFPGDYVLAIAGRGRTPVSRTGAIFNFQSNTELSGPDGPGGINPLSGWTGVGETGRYDFTLEATDFPAIPAPATAAAALMALTFANRRRRATGSPAK